MKVDSSTRKETEEIIGSELPYPQRADHQCLVEERQVLRKLWDFSQCYSLNTFS